MNTEVSKEAQVRVRTRSAVKRSLSKRKTILSGFYRLGTPVKKKMKKFASELTEKVDVAIENKEIKPVER